MLTSHKKLKTYTHKNVQTQTHKTPENGLMCIAESKIHLYFVLLQLNGLDSNSIIVMQIFGIQQTKRFRAISSQPIAIKMNSMKCYLFSMHKYSNWIIHHIKT